MGADENGVLYSGAVVFMVVSFKNSSKIYGGWLSVEIEEILKTLSNLNFKVRAVIFDNCAVNALSFKILRQKYGEENDNLSINYNGKNIYNLYDSVPLLKNIRNNHLNVKRFIFPSFDFNEFNLGDISREIHVDSGEISWHLFHEVYEKDSMLPGNLRKAPKINAKTLHTENDTQNVLLALKSFHEKTIPAIKIYFSTSVAAAGFLNVINSALDMCDKTRQLCILC